MVIPKWDTADGQEATTSPAAGSDPDAVVPDAAANPPSLPKWLSRADRIR